MSNRNNNPTAAMGQPVDYRTPEEKRIESLERQLAEWKAREARSNEVLTLTRTELATVTEQRDLLKDVATKATNDIRRCDYTNARSILLVALASLKGE